MNPPIKMLSSALKFAFSYFSISPRRVWHCSLMTWIMAIITQTSITLCPLWCPQLTMQPVWCILGCLKMCEQHRLSQCYTGRSAGQPAITSFLLGSLLVVCGSHEAFWVSIWKDMHISLSWLSTIQTYTVAVRKLSQWVWQLKVWHKMYWMC